MVNWAHDLLLTLGAWWSGLALLLTGPALPPVLTGYADADWVRLAPETSGRLVELAVRRGERVAAGDLLFRLDQQAEQAARDEAAARLATAQAQLANLQQGKRPEEIAVIAAQLAESEARLVLLQTKLKRRQELVASHATAIEGLDEAVADLGVERARIEGLKAQLAVARLPARADEIAAAQAQVQSAAAALAQAEVAVAKRTVRAPAAAQVNDLLHWPGELVAGGAPVVELLTPDALKVRAYVPEAALGRLRLGDPVRLSCDGCGPAFTGRISFLAREAEYTPPVIYSVASRQKLVFLLEVRPDTAPERLHPGQPVDLVLPEPRP